MQININGAMRELDVEPEMPLLWALRDVLNMTGTKFGCGMGLCGACTVHMNGMPVRSCMLPVMALEGAEIRTIEGLDHPVQKAWVEESVPQCGYCQSGQLMAASALLTSNPSATEADTNGFITNLCRCATYQRIRKGVARCAVAAPPAPPAEPAAPAAPAAPEGGAP